MKQLALTVVLVLMYLPGISVAQQTIGGIITIDGTTVQLTGNLKYSDGTTSSTAIKDAYIDGGEVGGANRELGNTDNFNLSFITNGLHRIHITNDGKVAIGLNVNSSTAPLEIVGVNPGTLGGFASGMMQVRGSGTATNSNSVLTGHSSFNGNTQLWYLGSTSSSNDNIAFINRQNGAVSFSTSNTTRMFIDLSGRVGFGIANPIHPIHMASGAHVTSAGVWTNASSRKLKENIKELTLDQAISALDELRPVSFNYKIDQEDAYVGFIAEDLPDLVATKDHKGFSPTDIIAVLTKVVQEQQRQIDELRAVMVR